MDDHEETASCTVELPLDLYQWVEFDAATRGLTVTQEIAELLVRTITELRKIES